MLAPHVRALRVARHFGIGAIGRARAFGARALRSAPRVQRARGVHVNSGVDGVGILGCVEGRWPVVLPAIELDMARIVADDELAPERDLRAHEACDSREGAFHHVPTTPDGPRRTLSAAAFCSARSREDDERNR
jgi:hypothetical protein